MKLTYKLINFDKNNREKFRISLNGETLHQSTKNSNTFDTFESGKIPMGSYSLDISILSDFKNYDP